MGNQLEILEDHAWNKHHHHIQQNPETQELHEIQETQDTQEIQSAQQVKETWQNLCLTPSMFRHHLSIEGLHCLVHPMTRNLEKSLEVLETYIHHGALTVHA